MSLPKYIKDTACLTSQEEQKIDGLYQRDEFPKGHYLIQEGNICRHIFYIEKGLARVYRHSDLGKEVTAFFIVENAFVTAFDSFYLKKPTHYNCVLLEDSIVYSFKESDFEEMLTKSHAMSRFLFHTTYALARKMSELLASVKFRTAEERYKMLLQDYPFIFQRVQLNYIASYLGITPETLSRLRAEK